MDEPHHDEINLMRLLRRLEKSVSNKEEWQPSSRLQQPEIWLKTQSALQKLKFARKLIKNVEFEDMDQSPKRIKQLNDTKIKLDRIEVFLKDCEKQTKPEVAKPVPILPTLPVPELSSEPTPPPYSEIDKTPRSPAEKRSPSISTAGLFISPPDPSEFSPTLITSAIPSLLPVNAADTASTSAYTRASSATPIARKFGIGNSITVQEELSSQLELMAAQLKRNAIHFSTSLAKDQAVVEDAQQKLEGNYDVMTKERVRLRDHRGKSGSTTCMVLAIVALVLVLFILMVSIIRFS